MPFFIALSKLILGAQPNSFFAFLIDAQVMSASPDLSLIKEGLFVKKYDNSLMLIDFLFLYCKSLQIF